MILELKEYTMTSLGYKSSENPLNSAKQTRPPFFFFKYRTLSLHSSASSFDFSSLPLPSLRFPATDCSGGAANDGDGLVRGVGPRTHCGSPLCSLFTPSRPHFLRPATDSDDQAISRRRPPPARQARWDSNSGDSFLSISTLFPRFGRGL